MLEPKTRVVARWFFFASLQLIFQDSDFDKEGFYNCGA
jgi:hypothetical protein